MLRLLFLFLLLYSCQSPQFADSQSGQPKPYTDEQKHIQAIIATYKARAFDAPNELQRRKFKDSIPMMITRYLHDTLKLIMKDFYVTIGEVNARPFGDIYALTAELSDDNINYWMERDYDTEKKMLTDTMYKIVSQLNERENRKVNMAFAGEVKPDIIYSDKYSIRVIVLPDSLPLKHK